jgi:cytochrome c biogenesis protein CcmG/thiol:disulfide interchange protein DsbE
MIPWMAPSPPRAARALPKALPKALAKALVAAAALASTCAWSCGSTMPASLRHPLAGGQAPAMGAMSAGNDTEVGIWHGAPVKATIVDFWASWCPGCRESLPVLDALYRDRRADGLAVVGVSVDERRDDAMAMAQSLHATFPIVVDQDARLLSQYRVGQVPLTFVVDRAGTVRWVGRDPEDMRRAVDVVLAE